jgi:nicotinamide-nucleotide amidase
MSSLFSAELLQDAEALLSELRRRAMTLATAESCTGGLLAGLLTEIPGASASVERGLVTYSNAAKTALLGVDAQLIADAGAVSADVARAMAEGALAHAPVDIAVSVTGIAGPEGGSPEKPVGLVYLSVARKGQATLVRECRFGAIGRSAIRLASVREAVALARAALTSPGGDGTLP